MERTVSRISQIWLVAVGICGNAFSGQFIEMSGKSEQGNEVILISDFTFKSSPSKEFVNKPDGSLLVPDSSVLTLISDKKEFCNYPHCSCVSSVGDVQDVRTQICSKPLVLRVTCAKHVPQGQKLNRKGEYLSIRDPEWWFRKDNTPWGDPFGHHPWGTGDSSLYGDLWIMPQFVVSVDTCHPNIRRKLNEGFDKAEALARQGTRFALEFDFNPMILEWWRHQGPPRYDQFECLKVTGVTGASVLVTNYGQLNHCFDCHAAWCVCWPAYCLSAIPYKIWRNVIWGVQDVSITMEGSAHGEHPQAIGYTLADLHKVAAVLRTEPGRMVTSVLPAVDYGTPDRLTFGSPRMRLP